MAPGGERAALRPGFGMASVMLRALLIIAVVLVPVLKCPAARDAAAGTTGTPAASVHLAEVPYALASLPGAEDHHDCYPLPAVIAAVSGVFSGWAIALTVVAFVALAVYAMWRPTAHGPPRGQQPHLLLSDGSDRLLHFCVMRR
ncbi:hypothetical protein BKG77_05560 [Mycobacteroides chelonae]|uniref:hypothetical protein n=1 Tax=Mycobacteroides chelonae TaxID=1774 RepID=UPI0008A8E318|nr:hypothetical protein [Mycobacteroides chelonae]OHU23158.1 hypothetical protein BKG77_05560 [Mycobacteroides chelonae]